MSRRNMAERAMGGLMLCEAIGDEERLATNE